MAACTHFAIVLLSLHFLIVSPAAQEDVVISTKPGKVKGKILSVLGGHVNAFLGIPYAKPPIGKLRFTAPEPVVRWDGVKDAAAFPNSCLQAVDKKFPGFKGAEMWNPNTVLSEDCLYLNVWSPHVNKTQSQLPALAPVLVWIYGGGFTSGTSSLDIYDGRFLCKSEGVVVVSMNYRLGPLGFLSLPNNKNIRGNAGLLDQRLALQWVVNNIDAFGGDPSKVTLFGESAGSASVGFHLLSPGSQGLFQRAIMESGSPNAHWATISQNEAWNRALMLADSVNCPTANSAKLQSCLQKADPGKIITNQFDVVKQQALISIPFAPIVDGDFLTDKPEALLNTGKHPTKDLLLGLNKDEGTYFVMYGAPGFDITGESLISRVDFMSGVSLSLGDASLASKEAATFHYTDWTDENNRTKNRDSLSSMVGDQHFGCPLLEFANRYSQRGGNTFLYLFDHRSSVNPWPQWMGVMHGYEIEFVFGMPLNPSLDYTKNEVNMTKKIMKHWANFARMGNPGIDGATWPMFTPQQQDYVTLNYNPPTQKKMMAVKECQLWNNLIPKIERLSDALKRCESGSGIILDLSKHKLLLFLLVTGLLVF